MKRTLIAFLIVLILPLQIASADTVITGFSGNVWSFTDEQLGIDGYVIEDFEDVNLVPGLLIALTDAATANANTVPSNTLPATLEPAISDPNSAQVFVQGVFDGSRALINRNLVETPIPLGYVDFDWTDTTFVFQPPAQSVGFSVHNMELAANLSINGQDVGFVNDYLTLGGGRNGYLRFDATAGDLITSIKLSNTAIATSGDAIVFDHLAILRDAVIDTDGDGIADSADNCTNVANPEQRDTDGDGFGNTCDLDFNNDCAINFLDYVVLTGDFMATGDLDTDVNGDSVVNFIDIGQFPAFFMSAPGPSGLSSDCD